HPVKRVIGERDCLFAVHDPHLVVHLVVARHRRVELGSNLKHEGKRDVAEHHSPAVGRCRRITLDDPDVMAGVVPLHQVGEKESGRAAADDANVHAAPRARASRASVSVISSRNSRFSILPTGLNGNSVTTSRRSGSLNAAMFRCRRKAISSSNMSVSPGFSTTNAHALSPKTASGIATSVTTL